MFHNNLYKFNCLKCGQLFLCPINLLKPFCNSAECDLIITPLSKFYSLKEIKRIFCNFFRDRGFNSEIFKGNLIRPYWRNDVLFVNASIYIFQPHFTIESNYSLPCNNFVFSQRCFRFNDLKEFKGNSRTHLLSFSMLTHTALNYDFNNEYSQSDTIRDAIEFFQVIGFPLSLLRFTEGIWEGGGSSGPAYEVYFNGLEVATLVFINSGRRTIIDTGYGLERIYISQFGRPNLAHLYPRASEKFKLWEYVKILLISFHQGLFPSKTGAGYLLQQVIRDLLSLYSFVVIRENMSNILKDLSLHELIYPTELVVLLLQYLEKESIKFSKGEVRIQNLINKFKTRGFTTQDLDILYESEGVPIELIQELDPNYTFISKVNNTSLETNPISEQIFFMKFQEDTLEGSATVTYVYGNYFSLDNSGIFFERGGQTNDIVMINGVNCEITFFQGNYLLYNRGDLNLQKGDLITYKVDPINREQTSKHHTILHIMMSFLSNIIGVSRLEQVGSKVTCEKATIDVLFPRELTPTEIELLVYELKAISSELNLQMNSYQPEIAKLFFLESLRIPFDTENVRIVTVYCSKGRIVSQEACGGTHSVSFTQEEISNLSINSVKKGKNKIRIEISLNKL